MPRTSSLLLALLVLVASCDDAGSFYSTPSSLPDGPLGTVLRTESIAPFVPGTKAFRILYLSQGMNGEKIAVSGLVGIPADPPGASGYDVVSWAHGTTGIADVCAPSTGRRFNHDAYDVAPEVLSQGWLFVATGYGGLGTEGVHRYLVGDSEGRSILDIVRAASHLDGVQVSGRVAFWGRSQGGHAALFAGELAPSYAPELEVMGTVVGAPASHIPLIFRGAALQTGTGAAYSWLMGFAYANAYGLPYTELYAQDTLDVIEQPVLETDCLAELSVYPDMLGGARLEGQVADDPTFAAALDSNSPGKRRQPAPVRIHQGTADTDVPPFLTEELVSEMCAAGDRVEFVEYPGQTHVESTELHVPEMVAFTRARFDGAPFVPTCP